MTTEKSSAESPLPVKIIDISGPISVHLPEEYIGVRQHAPPDHAMRSMTETGVWNLVQFCKDDMDGRLSFASRLIQNPKGFLDNPSAQVLGTTNLKKTMQTGSMKEQRWSFRASSQKSDVLKSIYKYLKDIPGAKTISDALYYIADELFTNAIYNAPFADSEYSLDRSSLVYIDPNYSAEIIVSYNSKNLFIGCLDHFGSFNCEEFIKRTAQNFKITADALSKTGVGGAGIGMLRVIELSPDIIVVVEKNKRTIVGCSFPLGTSGRKIRETPKNFYIQSFEILENEFIRLRVETRGARLLVRCKGTIDDSVPLKELNLKDVTELAFDMRFVREISGHTFKSFFDSLREIKKIKKINFDHVPRGLEDQFAQIRDTDPKLFDIRSFCLLGRCPSCQSQQEILKTPNGEILLGTLRCSLCGNPISEASA